MSKKIKQLSKDLINKIAAGEVIEKPVSVVKELVENSIDAGATKISIEVFNECRDLRIADNGCGIDYQDVELAFSKHATSKISTNEDLFDINTLGFRGEALSSIISIAKVTCTTKTKEAQSGVRVECENSEIKKIKTGCAVGTIFEVNNLFYNIPARLKFLKSAKTELSHIQEFVQAISFAFPNIAFELKYNEKQLIKTDGLNNLLNTVKTVFSDEVARNLREVLKTDKLSNLKISGYVSTPNFTRSSKKNYYIYINSRIVKCPVFLKAIDMAYKTKLSIGKYPFVVLNLEIPPEDIDVNVHPTKKEVRYKNANQIFAFIINAINSGFLNNVEVPVEPQKVVEFAPVKEAFEPNEEGTVYLDEIQPLKTVEMKPISEVMKQFEAPNEVQQKPLMNFEEFEFDENIIAQYKKTYILIEQPEGLEIVDQHIADERYIYETLKTQKTPASQLLFISDVLEVSPVELQILKENVEKFEKFGYKIEFLNQKELVFKKIPQLLSKINPKEILADILENLDGDINSLEEKILITTSCKAAIKANQTLSMWQMQELIKRWRKCPNNHTCPHGRPISKLIPHKNIANFFERNN